MFWLRLAPRIVLLLSGFRGRTFMICLHSGYADWFRSLFISRFTLASAELFMISLCFNFGFLGLFCGRFEGRSAWRDLVRTRFSGDFGCQMSPGLNQRMSCPRQCPAPIDLTRNLRIRRLVWEDCSQQRPFSFAPVDDVFGDLVPSSRKRPLSVMCSVFDPSG